VLSVSHLDAIRAHELDAALALTGVEIRGKRILELGTGRGHQMRLLKQRGAIVYSLDLEPSATTPCTDGSLVIYDGGIIPFASGSFDVVWTSHTLEHVRDLGLTLDELARVTVDRGYLLCVLPSVLWRFWSICTYYVALPEIAFRRLLSKSGAREYAVGCQPQSWTTLLRRILYPPRHGERGNAFSELLYFRAAWWVKQLNRAGWCCVAVHRLRLHYTSYSICDRHLSVALRRRLARVLGSASFAVLAYRVSGPH
jgi:SAM-dependent methyltransferase